MNDKKTVFTEIVNEYIKGVGVPHEVEPEILLLQLSFLAKSHGIDTHGICWPGSAAAMSRLLFECISCFNFSIVRKKSGSKGRTLYITK